jgi:flagellar basal-body rod protein FlgG
VPGQPAPRRDPQSDADVGRPSHRSQAGALRLSKDSTPRRSVPRIEAKGVSMRSLVCACALLVVGCQSSPSAADRAAVEAVASKDAAALRFPADPAVVQLLQSTLAVQARIRDVHLGNIACANITGYRRREAVCTTQDFTTGDGTRLQIPTVVKVVSVFTPTAMEVTNRSLDLAIDGEGFFAVTLSDGSLGYTRDGSLQLNKNGKLVTGSGNIVTPEINLPQDILEISVDPQGRVKGRTAGSPDTTTDFGQLTLSRFVNPSDLLASGNVLLKTDASGPAIVGAPGFNAIGRLLQGSLERSNVETMHELIALQAVEQNRKALLHVLGGLGIVVQ